VRTLAVWCPDWPVTAWGATPRDPVAVMEAGRVAVCSAAAREAGVAIGLRRREAESRCPGLALFERDPPREARWFEPLVAAVAGITPAVEVVRPGLCVLDARAPARYFGGEAALCSTVRTVAAGALAKTMGPESLPEAIRTGVADGIFAAALAARAGVIVPAARTAAFLSPFPLSVLRRPELVDLLGRLGIGSLGAFAALDAPSVLARFGPDAAAAHRLAAGREERPLQPSPPSEELCARVELDPPADRVDRALFAARTCAEDLMRQLEGRGLACTLLSIEAMTEHGEELVRTWRGEEPFGAEGIVERLRWQLEGWLAGTAAHAPSGGIELVRVRADEVVRRGGRQLALWGAVSEADRRATRGLDRLRGMLGPGAVVQGRLAGGRAPGDRGRFVPWGEEPPAISGDAPPWPGCHPQPAPALVHPEPLPAEVTGAGGEPIRVSARGRLSAAPARLSVGDGPGIAVVAWAGPWLSDERWWDLGARRRRARFQLLAADQRAHLCSVEQSRWWVEATYD
jgi:protein ImuB